MIKAPLTFFLIFVAAALGLAGTYFLLMKTLTVIPPAVCAFEGEEASSEMGDPNSDAGEAIVEIYSIPRCPYCIKAKALLDKKGIKYKEFDVSHDPLLSQQMLKRAQGQRTVPQIFIRGRHFGGYTELKRAADRAMLDCLLRAKPVASRE